MTPRQRAAELRALAREEAEVRAAGGVFVADMTAAEKARHVERLVVRHVENRGAWLPKGQV